LSFLEVGSVTSAVTGGNLDGYETAPHRTPAPGLQPLHRHEG
jgi:hypothetical protein